MQIIPYFPGCALSTKAKALDICARESMKMLGVVLDELSDWTCCGAVFPLAEDEHIRLVSPVRALAAAAKTSDRLVTLCSACFNVLRRTQRMIASDKSRRDRVINFMDDELPEGFSDTVKVLHLIEYLRDDFGFNDLSRKVAHPLSGIRIAPFYDCLTFRPPKEMGFDDPENPRVYHDYLAALGATAVDFPFRSECCGAHLSVSDRDVSLEASYRILKSARTAGADAVMTACPLCHYNLDARQQEMSERFPGFRPLPVFYVTQLLALALGLPRDMLGFEKNSVSPAFLLREKHLVEER